MSLGLFAQTTVTCQVCKICISSKVQLSFTKMMQSLAVTFPKNERMDQHGANPTLLIFLQTPSAIVKQGTEATIP